MPLRGPAVPPVPQVLPSLLSYDGGLQAILPSGLSCSVPALSSSTQHAVQHITSAQ